MPTIARGMVAVETPIRTFAGGGGIKVARSPKRGMKQTQASSLLAALALAFAAFCLREVHVLRVRLNRLEPILAAELHQPPNTEQRLRKLEAVTPDVGQTMLSIQLHFAKLYFAADAHNWELARFEQQEILEDLNTVAALKPEENGINLAGIITAFTNSPTGPLASIKDAIDVSDRPLFRKAYQNSILMCNACHQSTGRPFIVITVPTNPPVFNQQWEALNRF